TVVEKKGNKTFSRGVWAPAPNIATARAELDRERSTEAYARRRAADVRRRETKQTAYVEEFRDAVVAFLRFAPRYQGKQLALAQAVALHATPVGSGTVARTERIPVQERAEAAVIAWMRHQTTAYDHMHIARIKGERREVRRQLAMRSRQLLDRHRVDEPHEESLCPLCAALQPASSSTAQALARSDFVIDL
ncbi:MAG: DUF2293 domain-containing protein, partial [Myxococcota bacterium]